MEVVLRPTRQDAADLTAKFIANAIRLRPKLVLGLATGRTMESVYRRLVRMHHEEGLDFSLVETFNLDDTIGRFILNIYAYQNGVYIAEIKSADNTIIVNKFIILK